MDDALKVISQLIAQHKNPDGGLQAIVTHLRQAFPKYHWVGIYKVESNKLVLSAWDGEKATEHTEIDIGKGICGLAAREKRTVVVDDVNAHPDYLACFTETNSEIVVPLMKAGECLGEIDIDSRELSAFDESDRDFLEAVAGLIVDAYF